MCLFWVIITDLQFAPENMLLQTMLGQKSLQDCSISSGSWKPSKIFTRMLIVARDIDLKDCCHMLTSQLLYFLSFPALFLSFRSLCQFVPRRADQRLCLAYQRAETCFDRGRLRRKRVTLRAADRRREIDGLAQSCYVSLKNGSDRGISLYFS